MKLNYEKLSKKYLNLFENKDRCDFVLTDVLFAFEELYNTISDSRINSIIEIGSGTGILLNELSDAFPKKNFFGLDPHESGFHYYENIKKKLPQKNNLKFKKAHLKDLYHSDKYDLIFSFNVFEHVENQLNFIKESLTELRDNVKWTPRSELLNLSGLVIVFSVLFSLVIWAADSVLSRIVKFYFDIIS